MITHMARSPARLEMPDVECADISQHFNQVYEFIEDARSKGQGDLNYSHMMRHVAVACYSLPCLPFPVCLNLLPVIPPYSCARALRCGGQSFGHTMHHVRIIALTLPIALHGQGQHHGMWPCHFEQLDASRFLDMVTCMASGT